MTIKDIIAADMAATLFDTTVDETPAESITYTPEGGAPVTVTAVWSSEIPTNASNNEQGRSAVRIADVIIAASEVASPAINATVTRTLTGEIWTVTEVDRIGAGAANTLSVQRARPDERSRDGFRIQQ